MIQEQIQYLPLDQVECYPQVREQFDQAALEGLANSIKADGQLQPIRVRRKGSKFGVVDGERRTRAMRLAGLTTIAAIIEEKELGDGEVIKRQLILNLQREDLTPVERARGIQSLIEATGWTATQAASKLGLSNATVSKSLSLLSLPAAI